MNLAAREIPMLGNILGATSCFSYILPKLGNNPLLFVHGWRDNWTRWVNFITKITGDIEVEPGDNGGEGKTLTQLAEEYKSLKPKWGQSKEEKAQNKVRQKEITAKVQSALKAHNIYIFNYSDDNKKKPTVAAKQLAQFMADNGLGKETNVVSHSMGANVVANAVIKHGVQFNKWAAIAPVNRGSFLPIYGKIALMALSYRQTNSWEAGFAVIMGAGIIDSAQQYMDPVFGGVRNLYKGKNLEILMQNVRNIHIFAGAADTAVAPSRALIPGGDYEAKFYSSAEVPGQGFAGQHNTLTGSQVVQQDVMDFLYGN